MKLTVITNGDGPESREALLIADEINSEKGDVERVDWESDEAATLARLYDIYSTPAFILSKDDGILIEVWQGSSLPLVTDIKHLM